MKDCLCREPDSLIGALAYMGDVVERVTDDVVQRDEQDLDLRILTALAIASGTKSSTFVSIIQGDLATLVGASRSRLNAVLRRLASPEVALIARNGRSYALTEAGLTALREHTE